MIRTYKYGDTTIISPHFKACEFQCKCAGKHDFLIDDELIEKLELLITALGCSSAHVSSGFRCAAHDKAVGGSGTGQHTRGKAADVIYYDQAGKPIDSTLVCCAAEDIGFRGIARINGTSTHTDTRTGHWFGDETKGSSYCIDCASFYDYFGIERKGKAMTKGIDVSKHNGTIDWKKVKADGIDFAILRAGLGRLASQKDDKFEENYANAKAAGIAVGAYWYSYATTVDEAKEEARACIEVLKGKQFEYPIWFDQEEKSILDTGKANCSAMIRAFCDELEKSGYWAGLYTSRAFLASHVTDDIKSRYSLWVAEWGDKLNYAGTVGIWQHSSTGSVSGISGNVDLDVSYKDFPTMIKSKGLNGFGKAAASSEPNTVAEKPDSINVKVEINSAVYEGSLIRTDD